MSGSLRNELSSLGTDERPALRETVFAPVHAVAFWIAVILPFLYVPLLASGLSSTATIEAFFALLVANAIALLIGHPHLRE